MIGMISCTKQSYKYNVSYKWCQLDTDNRGSSHYEFDKVLTEDEMEHLCYTDSIILVDELDRECVYDFKCELINLN
jgi:hypothetical protein